MSTSKSRWSHRSPEDILADLRPQLAGLEQVRKEFLAKRKQGSQWMLGIGGIGLVLGLASVALGPIAISFVVILTVIGLIVTSAIFYGSTRKEYQARFKREVVAKLVKEMEPGISYQPEGRVTQNWFNESGLFGSRPDRYNGEDYFAGSIGETDLFFSEIHAEDRRTRTDKDGKTETYYVTIFAGLLVVADFHKHFQSEVLVTPDGLEGLGAFGRALQNLGGNVERMENPEFERLFKVKASDPIEARYILTPTMQERFVSLASKFSPKIMASFKGSLVYLAIPKNTDWFEGELGKPVDDPAQFRELLFQLSACFGLVEDLDLNTRIWTKK